MHNLHDYERAPFFVVGQSNKRAARSLHASSDLPSPTGLS